MWGYVYWAVVLNYQSLNKRKKILNLAVKSQLLISSLKRYHWWFAGIKLIQISTFQLLIGWIKPCFTAGKANRDLRLSRNLRTPGNAHLHIDSLCFYYSFVLVDDRIECKFTFIILHSYFVFPCMCQKLVRLQRKSRRFSLHFVAAERPYVSSLQNRSTTKTAFCYHKPCESVGVRFFVQPFLYHHALHVLRGLFFYYTDPSSSVLTSHQTRAVSVLVVSRSVALRRYLQFFPSPSSVYFLPQRDLTFW